MWQAGSGSSWPKLLTILQFTLQGTNTYVVGTGSSRLIIDTGQGIPAWIELLSRFLSETGIRLSHVLLTHWHGDHTGGVPDLLRHYPWLSEAVYKNSPNESQRDICDGDVFSVEGATVRAVHATGHSHDHMCFVLEEENAMFTGDNVLGHGTAAVEQLGQWMESLRTMRSHKCTAGFPAHGVVIRDLESKIDSELKSKTRRESQVVEALARLREDGGPGRARKGSLTVPEIVTAMHGEALDAEVRRLAIVPFVEEILRKLAEDGRVAFEIRAGQKKWFAI